MAQNNQAPDVGLASALRAPLQGRSRESYERMMIAAEQLLAEHRDGNFTLSEVSKVGKVSIGSIYNRFQSKEALLHAVQLRVLERVNNGMRASIAKASKEYRDLDHLVQLLVEAMAESLRQHAPQMSALMQIASNDKHVAATGRAYYAQTVSDYCTPILSIREQILRADPERSVHTTFRILYAAIARYLGFGSTTGAEWEGDWTVLKEDLATMIALFLRTS